MKKVYFIAMLLLFTTNLYSKEFLNTILHLNFGGMYSFVSGGGIINEEKNEIEGHELFPSSRISHYSTAYCFTLDVAPMKPILLGLEEHAIKFGVRGAYRFHFMQQEVRSKGVEYKGNVFNYNSWMVGPVMHYAPFISPSSVDYEYTALGGFTFYALFGKIDGDLTAFPALRKAGGSVGNSSSKISGYKMDFGMGAEISVCSINFGVNLYYSRVNYKMKEPVYAVDKRKGTLNEGCIELYFGIPVEFIIKPIIKRF